MKLPIFTLNSVLFPSMGARLHVFEDRYKAMIEQCIDQHKSFGVVLIACGIETGPPATPHNVGTLATIQAAMRQDDGSIDLFIVGTSRFAVKSHSVSNHGYVEAETFPFDEIESDGSTLVEIAADVKLRFQDYFKLVTEFAGVELPEYDFPSSPLDLSFLIASAMHLDTLQRQSMLELQDTWERLRLEERLLNLELVRIRAAIDRLSGTSKKVDANWFPEYFSSN